MGNPLGPRCLIGVAMLVAALAVPGVARGATIPTGDYVCSYSGNYAGTVNITKDGNYTVNDGKKKGRYALSRKTKIITFKTGVYKSFFGSYSKKDEGFDVLDKREGYYAWSCYRNGS